MNLLWKKDIPDAQKILIGTFMLWMLGALVPIFFRSFVPTQQWQKMAWGISLLLTAASAIWLRVLYSKNLWRPSGPWLTYGPFKRLLMAPLCMAFFVVVVWLNVAVTLPLGYTSLVHTKVTRSATVEKKRGSGRSCKHQIEIPDVRYLFFEFCVNADNFDTLPKGPVPAQLSIRRSFFGDHIHALRPKARHLEDTAHQRFAKARKTSPRQLYAKPATIAPCPADQPGFCFGFAALPRFWPA